VYPASAAFFAALSGSHTATSRVEVLDRGLVRAELLVTDGSARMDEGAAVRRSLTCTLGDATGTLTPATLSDLLAPAGNELRVWRGVSAPSVTEEVPLGVFGIADVDITSEIVGGVRIDLTAFDRAKKIQEARLDATYVVAAGTNYSAAIQALLRSRMSDITFLFEDSSAVTPGLVFNVGDDPWKHATDMARSIGCELFFDPVGRCVMRTVPDPDVAAVTWSYVEGEGAMILGASKKLTREYTYNGVIASGEGSAITNQQVAPVSATAWDDNPHSPTYYLGKFGKKPRLYASPFVTTQAQALSAARAILRQSMGLAEDVSFSAVVNPAHEPGDVVSILVSKSKINARYVLSSFSVPLTHAGTLSATTRRRTA
jgi:hypothetical protein